MLMEITIIQGRYAPGQLLPPQAEVLYWTPVARDQAGNETGELTCPQAVEIRFVKPAATANFHVTIRSKLENGVGTEWQIVLPADRTGLVALPVGFTAEQSVMGAVYRLPEPRDIRILADQYAGMPGINLTAQLL